MARSGENIYLRKDGRYEGRYISLISKQNSYYNQRFRKEFRIIS